METATNLLNKLEKYSLFYLSKYSVTKKKFRIVLNKKITKDYNNKKISLQEKEKLLSLLDTVSNKFEKLNLINENIMIKNRIETFIVKGYSIKKIYCKLKNDQFEEKLINDEIQRLNNIDNIELNLLENFCKKKKIQNLREILDNDDKKSFYKILNKLIAEGFRKDACLKFFKIF